MPSCPWSSLHVCSHQRVREGSKVLGAAGTMNELAPRGHLRPLGGRENSRRARPESRSPRRCAHAWQRCLLSAGRPKHIDQGTTNRHARAGPLPQLHMRKGVNRNPSRRPGLAVSDSNLHAVKTGHSESAAFPGYTPYIFFLPRRPALAPGLLAGRGGPRPSSSPDSLESLTAGAPADIADSRLP